MGVVAVRKLIAFAIASILAVPIVFAAVAPASAVASCDPALTDKTFTGANSSAWSDAGNWQPSGIPLSTSDVCVPIAKSVLITSGVVAADVYVAAGGTLTVGNAGLLDLGASGVLVNDGTIGGGGAVSADITNNGTLAPANGEPNAGLFGVLGDFTQTASGRIETQWLTNGGTPATHYGRVNINGNADISGTIAVSTPATDFAGNGIVFRPLLFTGSSTIDVSIVDDVSGIRLIPSVGANNLDVTTAIATASVSGTLTNDWNFSGSRDADEPPMPGVIVFVDVNQNEALDLNEPSAVTGTDGSYTINELVAGAFEVRIAPQTDLIVAEQPGVPAIAFGTSAVLARNGIVKYNGLVFGTIRDTRGNPVVGLDVFADSNNDEIRQSSEERAVTKSTGVFSFASLKAGTYTVGISAGQNYVYKTPVSAFSVTGAVLGPNVSGVVQPLSGGYLLAASDGGVFAYGNMKFSGSLGATALNAPIVSSAALPDGSGYVLAASDGGVFAFGSAKFYGSLGSIRLNKPIVAVALTPDAGGYYLIASDGGVFTFGNAQFKGSLGATPLNAPIISGFADRDGSGYTLVAADGGVFNFDSKFAGSLGALKLNAPVVGAAADPDGSGYWLVASDGGVFSFDAPFLGSAGGTRLAQPVVGIAASPTGAGYYLVARDGGVLSYPGASEPNPLSFFGSQGGKPLNKPIVGMAAS